MEPKPTDSPALLDHDWRFETQTHSVNSTDLVGVALCTACGTVRIGTVHASPDLSGGCPRRRAPSGLGRVANFVKGLPVVATAAVAAVASFAGLVFLVIPNVAPASTRGLMISDVSVEEGVTWQSYQSRRPVVRASIGADDVKPCPDLSSGSPEPTPAPSAVGAVVDLAWTAQGMHGRCLELASSLLDASTGMVIAEMPVQAVVRADTQVSDSATYLIWVDLGRYGTGLGAYIVRVEFFDGQTSAGVRLAYKDTGTFCYPQPCPSPFFTPGRT
jgi:hypothetical protein